MTADIGVSGLRSVTRDGARVIRLDEVDRVWVPHGGQENAVLMTAQQVAEACRIRDGYSELPAVVEKVRALWGRLVAWLQSHSPKVARASLFLGPNGGIQFIAVQRFAGFDAELTDALTDLDLDIANHEDFDRINLNVMLLPAGTGKELDPHIAQW